MDSALQCSLGENTLTLLLYTLLKVNECILFKLIKIEAHIEKGWRLGIVLGNIQANIS